MIGESFSLSTTPQDLSAGSWTFVNKNNPMTKKTMIVAIPARWLPKARLTAPSKAGPTNAVALPEKAYRPNILVITSGGNEPVLDSINTKNSIFSIAIQNVLNDNKSISASTLFDKVKSATKNVLLKENFKQTPQYSPLIVGGHTGGDFYFTAKK